MAFPRATAPRGVVRGFIGDALQVERLKATGRWHPPSGNFTIRTNMLGDAHVIHLDDDRPLPDGCTVFDPTERQSFCDYVMDGETFVRAVHLELGRYPGLTPRTKQGLLKGSCGPGNQPWPFYDYSTRRHIHGPDGAHPAVALAGRTQ